MHRLHETTTQQQQHRPPSEALISQCGENTDIPHAMRNEPHPVASEEQQKRKLLGVTCPKNAIATAADPRVRQDARTEPSRTGTHGHLRCNVVFARVVGVTLHRGFLLHINEQRVPPAEAEVLPEFHTLRHACKAPDNGGEVVGIAENACNTLVETGVVRCARFLSDDLGQPWVRENVPRKALTFFTLELPDYTIGDYAQDTLPALYMSEEAIIAALIYVGRVIRAGVPFTPRSAARLFVAALLVATKIHEDIPLKLASYAKIVGLPPNRLCKLETALLDCLQFNTFIHPAEYVLMLYSLRSAHFQLHQTIGRWSAAAEFVALPILQQVKRSTAEGEDDEGAHDRDSPLLPRLGAKTMASSLSTSADQSFGSLSPTFMASKGI